MTPAVSVVVPTLDKAPRLRLVLACLAGQQLPRGEWEVVVVDDGCRDQTAAVLAEAAEWLPLRVVPGPGRGRAAVRNHGAAHARGGHLVFLDDDVLVGDGFLRAHRAAAGADTFVHGPLRELPASQRLLDELAGASYGQVRRRRAAVLDGSAGPRYRLVANELERAVEAMESGRLPDVAPWLGCVGANLGLPRSAWERSGGFDKDFGTTWGCEDLHFGLVLHGLGLRRTLAAEALGVHLTHARPDRWEAHARNQERFAGRHPLPAVRALPVLLGPRGDPAGYVAAVQALGGSGTPPGRVGTGP